MDNNTIVARINAIFDNLQHLENSQLRLLFDKWNKRSTEVEEEERLFHIFALIKELMRRFTIGPVIVAANETDKTIADSVDYVEINADGQAVYSNHWLVGGSSYEWKMIPYDEQLLAGYYIAKCFATQLATGEGKTLVAIFPAIYMSLSRQGVHLMTVNEYLSKRDFEITRPLYAFWGIKTACVENTISCSSERRLAYLADVTFGSMSTFIFDYLFDNLAEDNTQIVQRKPHVAIVDELDSILIDDANQLHIVSSGFGPNLSKNLQQAKSIVIDLIKDTSTYRADQIRKHVELTPKGEEVLKRLIAEKNELDSNSIKPYVSCMLYAYVAYLKDIDYIVDNGKVIIIDLNTGRPRYNERWENGIHSAVECKEDVSINSESVAASFISIKNYFKKYNSVCGMSGTLIEAKEELNNIYKLNTVKIPSHKPSIRRDYPIQIFQHYSDKIAAIIDKVNQIHLSGNPILLCCNDILECFDIEKQLIAKGLSPQILIPQSINKESQIISQAGNLGSITIATNLAGRGTDIILSSEALEVGGLFVIGTTLYKSKRIDQQLAGRAGRQGQPGASLFFASAEDTIYSFNPGVHPITTESLCQAQIACESFYYNERRTFEIKDDIIDKYRNLYFQIRREIVNAPKIADLDCIKKTAISTDEIRAIYQEQCLPYIIKYRQNNKIDTDILIPFSCDKKPFAISFIIDRCKSDFMYFQEHFLRQSTLQTYDYFWHAILKEINPTYTNDCNREKIESQLQSLYTDIQNLLNRRLSHPCCLLPKCNVSQTGALETKPTTIHSSQRRIR